jgi:tRNA-Thr(GGU) m(6)t(6)A37 methyltransferase TsaA
MSIIVTPIGLIHTPFHAPAETPIQASRSNTEGWIEVFPEFVEGLQDIEAFSHLHLLYHLHQADQVHLLVEPFLDDRKHGVFATRHPFRPNHIGISIVELVSRLGNRLNIVGVDMLDQTPLLDIKPYVPDFDQRSAGRSGWYENRSKT